MTNTFTATAYARAPRAVHAGVNSQSIVYNSGTTVISATPSVIFMTKIPAGATILDVFGEHTFAEAECPVDVGIFNPNTGTASYSAFISGGTKGAITRAAKVNKLPYTVSVSDDAANRYSVLTLKPDPASKTSGFIARYTVLYTMDA